MWTVKPVPMHLTCGFGGACAGSTRFRLTLINRMEPTALKPDLKEEPEFGMGKVSVSWHADSSLEHESTIAVSSPPDSLAVRSASSCWTSSKELWRSHIAQ